MVLRRHKLAAKPPSTRVAVSAVPEIKQEYVDNEATGVEVEEVDRPQVPDEPRPWDPDQIRIHTKTFSLLVRRRLCIS